jgi:hypothetical protein
MVLRLGLYSVGTVRGINWILRDFRRYLIQKKIKPEKKRATVVYSTNVGLSRNTADAVEETAIATQDTIHTLKVATREVAETAPTTLKTLKEVSNKVRSKITKKSLH